VLLFATAALADRVGAAAAAAAGVVRDRVGQLALVLLPVEPPQRLGDASRPRIRRRLAVSDKKARLGRLSITSR